MMSIELLSRSQSQSRYDLEGDSNTHHKMQWVTAAAWVQGWITESLIFVNRLRRRLVLPLAHWGGRDMVLLRNGQWLDAAGVSDSHVEWRYSSEKHELRHHTDISGGRLVRWPWLSVGNESHDLSDFFEGLRLSAGHTLSKDKAFMLYATQKGHLPHGTVTIIKRNGDEEIVHTYEEPPMVASAAAIVNGVNFVS